MTQTVLSLTPLPLDRDSRTLRIAASFARLGYRSVVLENLPSRQAPSAAGVELITLGVGPRRKGDSPHDNPADLVRRHTAGRLPRGLTERLHFLTFAAAYGLARPCQGLWQAPAADLYYLHEYRLYPLVRLLQARHSAPLVYDAHDFYPEVWDRSRLSPFWRRRFLPFLESLEAACVTRADQVVAVGDGVAALFRRRYGRDPIVLRNGHDSRLDEPPEHCVRVACGLDGDAFLLVHVGNHKEGQADDLLVRAMARLPAAIHLALVGRGYEPLSAIAAEAGVADRVHLTGPVRPEQVVPFIASADAAIILYRPLTENYRNALPNKFFQSVAAGLPTLYPASLPELVRLANGCAGLIPMEPESEDALAAVVGALHDRRADLPALRAECKRLAQSLAWVEDEALLGTMIEDLLMARSWKPQGA